MSTRSNSYEILKNTNFRFLVIGRFCLEFALQLQSVVLGWQVYDIKKDPLYLGLIGLASAIPAISLALIGGHVVDRGQPLSIYRRMVTLALGFAAILLGVVGGIIPLSHDTQLLVIFAVVIASGVVRAFAWPSLFALTPQIVPRHQFTIAQTWLSATFQIAAITGPAAGGVIYAWHGALSAYVVICLMIGMTVFAAYRLKVDRLDRAKAKSGGEPLLTSLSAGVRFVFSNQVVLGALSLDMFAVLFGGATALLPIFAGEILLSGPQSLGVLRSAPAIGALATSLFMIHRPLNRAAGTLLLWVVVGFGACMIGFGLSRSLWVSVVLLGLSGAFDAVSVVIRHTILQLSTPDEMRGRVSAVNMIFIGSSNEIGEFESGIAAKLMGTVMSVVFGGCMTILVVAGAAIFAPKLRKLDLDRAAKAQPSG